VLRHQRCHTCHFSPTVARGLPNLLSHSVTGCVVRLDGGICACNSGLAALWRHSLQPSKLASWQLCMWLTMTEKFMPRAGQWVVATRTLLCAAHSSG
jgi:hypothetical protein